jgi:hypothetical protein
MTPPASFLERYEHGEHVAVWNDLLALGDDVAQPPLYADALAVAQATMRRVRHNLEVLIPRLRRLNYAFGGRFFAAMTPDEEAEARRQAPFLALPGPQTPVRLAELEAVVGPLPLSLRAFYEVVGSVNLVGRFPPGTFGPAEVEGRRQRAVGPNLETPFNPAFDYELDPLFVWSLEMTHVLVQDWQDRRITHGQPIVPYRLPIGPDCGPGHMTVDRFGKEIPRTGVTSPPVLPKLTALMLDFGLATSSAWPARGALRTA